MQPRPQSKTANTLALIAAALLSVIFVAPIAARELHEFDVVIVGGSTAAFAAAISAAEEGSTVALLEPTDWIGGQITSSGVPAIDEAWHKLTNDDGTTILDVAKIARTPANISPHLREMLKDTGCPGKCWVSRFCFEPREFLDRHLLPLERKHASKLTVFRETVLKSATTNGRRITSLTAVRRTVKNTTRDGGYDRLPSKDLRDWYSANDSDRFSKEVLVFSNERTIYIDASEWGELLVLADAPYLIGVENEDGSKQGDETLGQSITYGFVQELHATVAAERDRKVPNPTVDGLGFGDYRDRKNAWESVWTYRRLRAKDKAVGTGDLSLQNWGYYVDRNEGGNDYPFGYLFLDRGAAKKQANSDWQGGVDLTVLAAAEDRAFAWHHWMKQQTPANLGADRVALNHTTLGTGHGLSKLPYIRDTRRSIGIDGFLLQVSDLQPSALGKLARTFQDRIAIGAYPVDIHPLANRKYPDYIDKAYDIAPFTIPFRALTNDGFDNLLVAGKTMAQSFLANSATRLHPTEWSTGTAAGVAAAMMADKGKSPREISLEIGELQSRVSKRNPIDWTVAAPPAPAAAN